MGIWLVFAFVLLTIAAVMHALARSVAACLLCAGLACWILPAAWAYLR